MSKKLDQRWTCRGAILSVLFLAVVVSSQRTLAQVDDVWAMEESYWRFAKAGDVDGYLSLWHEDFVGWSCRALQPERKDTIAGWVGVIRDERLDLNYELHREAIQYFGDLAVVHYKTPIDRSYPDGRILYAGELWKFTHTWMRVGDQWQIIGGMCGKIEQ